MRRGYYKIRFTQEKNTMLGEVKTFVVLKELSSFGGNFRYIGICYILTGFILLFTIVLIRYIHKLKYKVRNKVKNQN